MQRCSLRLESEARGRAFGMNERVRELVRGANSRANWNARPPRHGGPGSPATPSGVHSVATRLSLDVHLGLACRGTSRAVSVPFFSTTSNGSSNVQKTRYFELLICASDPCSLTFHVDGAEPRWPRHTKVLLNRTTWAIKAGGLSALFLIAIAIHNSSLTPLILVKPLISPGSTIFGEAVSRQVRGLLYTLAQISCSDLRLDQRWATKISCSNQARASPALSMSSPRPLRLMAVIICGTTARRSHDTVFGWCRMLW